MDRRLESHIAIQRRQRLSKRVHAWKQRSAATQEGERQITCVSDWSSSQSTSSIMTPLEGWTDAGSDTTEEFGENAASIEDHELRPAVEHTQEFTRYLEVLIKVDIRKKTTVRWGSRKTLHRSDWMHTSKIFGAYSRSGKAFAHTTPRIVAVSCFSSLCLPPGFTGN